MDVLAGPRLLHKQLALRLAGVCALMSLILGVASVEIEHRKIDEYVFQLATAGAEAFNAHWNALPSSENRTQHEAQIQALLWRLPFVGVRIADRAGTVLADVRKEGADTLVVDLRARYPINRGDHQPFHVKAWEGDRLFIMIAVPLRGSGGRAAGHLEGIYEVDPPIVAAIKDRIRVTVLLVVLVVAATTMAVYPVVVLLNRRGLRLARDLLDSNLSLMRTLGSAIAQRDADTDAHNYRVTLYAITLGESVNLPAKEMRALTAGAFLHDIGKIGIPDRILRKADSLTPEESALMRKHVPIGAEILNHSPWLSAASAVVTCHHEWFDGTGYPYGLSGNRIPLIARVFALADVFDALTSARPYKSAYPLDTALGILRERRGRQFDPSLCDRFGQLAPALYARFGTAPRESLAGALVEKMRLYFEAEATQSLVTPTYSTHTSAKEMSG